MRDESPLAAGFSAAVNRTLPKMLERFLEPLYSTRFMEEVTDPLDRADRLFRLVQIQRLRYLRALDAGMDQATVAEMLTRLAVSAMPLLHAIHEITAAGPYSPADPRSLRPSLTDGILLSTLTHEERELYKAPLAELFADLRAWIADCRVPLIDCPEYWRLAQLYSAGT